MVKTSELTGAALDWAVAKLQGLHKAGLDGEEFKRLHAELRYNYSTDWAQGGPIVEREKIKVFPNVGGTWTAQVKTHAEDGTASGQITWHSGSGTTPLIAAMRCFCASKLGDEVEVPKELT